MSNLQILITDDNNQAIAIYPEKIDTVQAMGGSASPNSFNWLVRIIDTDGKLHDMQFNDFERMNRYAATINFLLKGLRNDSTSAA